MRRPAAGSLNGRPVHSLLGCAQNTKNCLFPLQSLKLAEDSSGVSISIFVFISKNTDGSLLHFSL